MTFPSSKNHGSANKSFFGRLCALLGTVCLTGSLAAAPNTAYYQKDSFEEVKAWQEDKVEYPALPEDPNQISIYLSASSTNQYWVDKSSISVGNDGVIRYSLTVLSSGGVRGTTYEGIRCETRELRRYAVLRNGTEWVRSRNESWSRITESPGHRQHAVLYLGHFCPDGIAVRNVSEAIRNLSRGGRAPGDSPAQSY